MCSTTSEISTCAFVSCARSCQVEVGFANYLRLPACVLHDSKPEITALLLLLWLLVLFVVLGTTAEDFFCPALGAISDTLGLSDNVAGVTFLALGNGAPDIFSV